MKKALGILLILALLLSAVPALAGDSAFDTDITFENQTYHLTLEGIEIQDGQMTITIGGFGSTIPFRNNNLVVIGWAAAVFNGQEVRADTVNIKGDGSYAFAFARGDMPQAVLVYPYEDENHPVTLWQEGTDDGGADAGGEGIPEALVGTWRGTGTPKGGGTSIDLTIAIEADGSGEYTFVQGDYTESYPFSVSSADSRFSVDIPADNALGIVGCEGDYALEGGVLKLDITTRFSSGGSYAYTAECEKAAGEPAEEPSEEPSEEPADAPEAEGAALAVGDTVILGRYDQDNDASNGAEPIEWRVLKIDGDDATLITVYSLDAMSYDDASEDVTWETCRLRRWLNDNFLNAAFTDAERAMLETVTVRAAGNPQYACDAGNDTQDVVFLLSIDEVETLFPSDEAQIAYATETAKANGAWLGSDNGASWWWLRSPGSGNDRAAGVKSVGSVRYDGDSVTAADSAVRPAVVARISALGGLAAPAEPEAEPEEAPDVEPEAAPEEAPETAPEEAPETAPDPQALIGEVLDALGDDAYRAVYEALSAGEVVEKGSKGDVARGVQQTLIAFGQDISADGSVGPKTIAALNAVQEGFGMAPTEALDADGYAALLPRLLAAVDEDAADELVRPAFDDGEYDYMRGCTLALQGRFYSAKRAFEESGWSDWEARAEACVQAWPKNGQLYKNSAVKGSGTELIVKVYADPDVAKLIKIYTQDGTLARTLFIGGEGKASTSLPGGTYVIKEGTGSTWYGEAEAFGSEGYYEIMTFGDESEVELRSGRSYTITINVQEANPDADDVGSAYESWGDF